MQQEHVDVLIVGAGISGIGAACHLSRECPAKSFAILERREDLGGTWDLFRYPGIRSDSDMMTFGYKFRPWKETRILADGPSIKRYVRETAREYDVHRKIRYGLKVTRASFSSERATWTVEAIREATGETERYTCNFLIGCTGYYNYDTGYRPSLPGEPDYTGRIIHPQHWPEDLDYRGKRVVVIGSGATAITLIPSMADDAEHITMLQRTPSYIMSVPANDSMAESLYRRLPDWLVYRLIRGRNIRLQRFIYNISQRRPKLVRRLLRKWTRRHVGDQVDPGHFQPDYDPWDQRMCIVPDGDLFKKLRDGEASVVTGEIETFTENGIRLKDGTELEADLVIAATGLELELLGGMQLEVDGEYVDVSKRLTYKGVMLEGVPNAAVMIGYINASWTLKVDIACEYVCRLLNYMGRKGYDRVVPRDREGNITDGTIMDKLQAGYVQRAANRLPRQGLKYPWRVLHDYRSDVPKLTRGPIADRHLEFRTRAGEGRTRDAVAETG